MLLERIRNQDILPNNHNFSYSVQVGYSIGKINLSFEQTTCTTTYTPMFYILQYTKVYKKEENKITITIKIVLRYVLG